MSLADTLRSLCSIHHCGYGFGILVAVMLGLSFLANVNFEQRPTVYIAGSIAEHDITASRELLVEDTAATNLRRERLIASQPSVFDLNYKVYDTFHTNIVSLFREINNVDFSQDYTVMTELVETLPTDMAEEIIAQLSRPEVEKYALEELLPAIHEALHNGLVSDIRLARVGSAGIIIRVQDTGEEIFRPDITVLPDIQATLLQIHNTLYQKTNLSQQAKRALTLMLSTFMPPSLTFNEHATETLTKTATAQIKPVYYTVQKGEVVLRKGDIVTHKHQIILQAMHKATDSWLQWHFSLGLFGIALCICIGLFMAPSGKPSTPLRCKDHILMALLLAFFVIAAKIVYILGFERGEQSTIMALAYAFPVGGAIGLVAMVFAARRYCTMGILLSLFVTVMFHESIGLFFFHFLSGMLTTWLVTRAQHRQDVVWSIIPLSIGQIFFWLAATLLHQSPLEQYPMQLICVILNSSISIMILFAFSPILELVFGYTTRFQLMELMSLEQPLMQEMMVTIPGTYHHSLVVANMVEAGASVIGANSLLCKVAALYHDAGKLQYPEYFIENQFGARNKHDKLAPSMSALIIISHTKKGTELAEKHKLGREIIDIIRQHHGTRMVRFFYQKAVDLGENPRESDYCYPGPRPQTKEAAILMLADSVEASSRTLSDPTPARLKSHIDTIVKGIFSEGQLDESELTFKDLHKISEQFNRVLAGIFHQRIAYPPSTSAKENKER